VGTSIPLTPSFAEPADGGRPFPQGEGVRGLLVEKNLCSRCRSQNPARDLLYKSLTLAMTMKTWNQLRRAAGLLALLLLASCASNSANHQPVVRFHEQDASDVILHFSSWDLITIYKPNTRDGDGFLPLYRRAEAEQVLARPEVAHNLAVVICGYNYSLEQEAYLQEQWASLLGGLGFHRLVFLRSGGVRKINGLTVLKEVQLGSRSQTGG